ncbi:protein trichome birefringence-like 13 [Pyrus ussuriensis x Pyrus communis]|uniref:Protein trichome birefringence-like 13 n=1 Tax=Pyrus ussuriensis x Pyrus communis TaxID=2448454 RepID=A0A5N5IA14_9ROSA|nr:protein trichome birefringence-like 13 [Pyrus ussuriensis x Pyrus communis]
MWKVVSMVFGMKNGRHRHGSFRLRNIRVQLGFNYAFGVTSCGRSRGLSLLWNDDTTLRILSSSSHHINEEVGGIGDAKHWRFTGFYGHPHPVTKHRHETWDLLRTLASRSSIPRVCRGGFNGIFLSVEKEGGNLRHIHQILSFHEAVGGCNLMGLGFRAENFTWITPGCGGILGRVMEGLISYLRNGGCIMILVQSNFFRTQSPRHFEGGDWDQGGSCNRLNPLLVEQVEDLFSVKNNGTNVEARLVNQHLYKSLKGSSFQILNITHMSEFRADTHPSTASGKKHDDCMHGCLPGLTDTWNGLYIKQLNVIKSRN